MPHQIDPRSGQPIFHGFGFPGVEQVTLRPLVSVPPPPGDADAGGIIGAVIDIVGGIIGGQGPSTFQFPPAPGGTLPPLPTNGGFTLGGAIPAGNGCLPNPCCSGQHLNKSTGCDGSPPGSKCVSNRRMNSLNPQALRRATRRLKGFERAVKSTRKQLRTLSKI